jgi:uncharacterized protein
MPSAPAPAGRPHARRAPAFLAPAVRAAARLPAAFRAAARLPAALVLAAAAPSGATALEVPPPPGSPIYDGAQLLGDGARSSLAQEIVAFEAETSNQIAVAIFPSLDGESLEEFTVRLAERWRPGDKERSNGVILAIFVQDRRARIEVGYGLEGALPDVLAARIIRNELVPAFRAGDFDAGVTRAVRAIMAATKGEYTARSRGGNGGIPVGAIVAIVILLIIFSRFSRQRGRGYSGRGIDAGLPPFWLPTMGRRGGGIGGLGRLGGSGRSGFGGFRGGSFGGGGASGRW